MSWFRSSLLRIHYRRWTYCDSSHKVFCLTAFCYQPIQQFWMDFWSNVVYGSLILTCWRNLLSFLLKIQLTFTLLFHKRPRSDSVRPSEFNLTTCPCLGSNRNTACATNESPAGAKLRPHSFVARQIIIRKYGGAGKIESHSGTRRFSYWYWQEFYDIPSRILRKLDPLGVAGLLSRINLQIFGRSKSFVRK